MAVKNRIQTPLGQEPMIKDLLFVGVGGMCGAVLRYLVMLGFAQISSAWAPAATLTVNVLGCFAMGYFTQWSLDGGNSSTWTILVIRVGLLGSFTTFSSYALDVVRAWSEGRATLSAALLVSHILLGIAAIGLGFAMAKSAIEPAEL